MPLPNVAVTFTLASNNNTARFAGATSPVTVTTDAQGKASVSVIAPRPGGSATVTAVVPLPSAAGGTVTGTEATLPIDIVGEDGD